MKILDCLLGQIHSPLLAVYVCLFVYLPICVWLAVNLVSFEVSRMNSFGSFAPEANAAAAAMIQFETTATTPSDQASDQSTTRQPLEWP